MEIKNSFRENTGQVWKKIFKGERRVVSSRFNARTVFTFGFWVVLITVIFCSFLSYYRTSFLNERVNAYQDETQSKIDSLNEVGFTNSPAGETFSKNFLMTYINIPIDPEQREKRNNTLQHYLAEGLTLGEIENLSEFKGDRALKDIHLYDVKDVQEDSAKYVYRIRYQLSNGVEQNKKEEVNGKDSKEKTETEKIADKENPIETIEVMIVVPIGTDGQSFNVVEQPYFQAVPGDTRLTAIEDKTDPSKKNTQMEQEMKQFVTQFFTSYTENTVDEMAYLMENPESLKDTYSYKGVEDFIVYEGKKKGQYKVKTLVHLKEDQSGVVMKLPFTLIVSKENNKFYVQKLKHTIGG
ncbi:conjugal transfer protein [Alkalihalobacillus sp. TS-13]|uniref:conjugal transfer protein n=1 Tax=Alkalihalobacillus sp. TS-13 TaxID=2842455 RepID=UPI001C87D436|nr:conjugal transfer protein [Alkalihalobacillus sp. TS-13]